MLSFDSYVDAFHCNMNLSTEMPLPAARETILGFFERVQKSHPSLRNFYTRETGDCVLEEDKELGHQRWVAIESKRVSSGFQNPPDIDTAFEQHLLILELLPYMLSVSPLDCEALDFMMGFDMAYRGNHDELVAEALGGCPAIESLLRVPGVRAISYEPSITLSLDESCRMQARLLVETRTNAYHVRRGEYPEENISVYFTLRQYGSLEPGVTFEKTLANLRSRCDELIDDLVVDQILRPLAQAIATR
jgi:hypothetical protein